MQTRANAGVVRRARGAVVALAAAVALCLPAVSLYAQHRNSAPRAERAPRFSQPRGQGYRPQAGRPQNYNRQPRQSPQYRGAGQPGNQNQQYRGSGPPGNQSPQYRGYPAQNNFRQGPANSPSSARPAAPGYAYPNQGFAHSGQGTTRPNYPNVFAQPNYTPPGHLGSWLNAHRNVPPQAQEQMLRNDPSFSRLPPAQQQRLMQQLNRVDRMPEAQRERRLARAENLERLSPQERAQVNESAREWRTLPADRQQLMKEAFRNLSEVPPDQRQTVLNSARYQNVFSPQERNILGNVLSVEPYQPPR